MRFFIERILFGSWMVLRMYCFYFIRWSFWIRFMRNWWLLFTLYPCKLELRWWFECCLHGYWVACQFVEVVSATWYQCRHTVWALLCILSQGCISWHQLVHSYRWCYLSSLVIHREVCSAGEEWLCYLLSWSSFLGWWTTFESFGEVLKGLWFICRFINLANSSIGYCLLHFIFRSDVFRSLNLDLNSVWALSGYVNETVPTITANIGWLFLGITFIFWHTMTFSFCKFHKWIG